MNYLNIRTEWLRAHEYIGSDPVDRATWLNLMGYCAEQENGGIILGCKNWKDRLWQQTCGVTKDEVEADSMLWQWDGDDMLVWNYPVDKESEVKTKRVTAQKNGQNGGRPKKNQSHKPTLKPTLVSTLEPTLQSGKEGNGRERNGREDPPKPPGAEEDQWKLLCRVWETGKVDQIRWPWESWHTKLRTHPDFDCAVHGDQLIAELVGMKEKEVGSPMSWFSAAIRRVLEGPRRYSGDFTGSENSNPALAGSPFEVL